MKRSRFIAKLFGVTGIIFVLIMLVTGGGLLERLTVALSDPGYLLNSGIMTLIIGVALVVGHNVWDGSWRVVITVIGYLSLLKGIAILAWPDSLVILAKNMIESGMIPVQMFFAGAFYGWLAWLGFRPESGDSESSGVQEQVPPKTQN
jgi:hypothetical protein